MNGVIIILEIIYQINFNKYTLKYWRTDPRLMRFDWSKKEFLKKYF